MGVLFLENKGQWAPPHKELGLSNLYAGTPSILYVGILYEVYVLFSPPILTRRTFQNSWEIKEKTQENKEFLAKEKATL